MLATIPEPAVYAAVAGALSLAAFIAAILSAMYF